MAMLSKSLISVAGNVGGGGSNPNAWDFDYAQPSSDGAWDITTATEFQQFSVSAQDGSPYGLFFKPDGTKMYVVGDAGNDVNEYNLSTGWDISTASYSQNFSVATQETNPSGIFFKSDGTKMYVNGILNDYVNEYSLSTAWDISTASYSQQKSLVSQDQQVYGIFFKADGTKMFAAGNGGDAIYEYSLSTAWDISTLSYSQSFSVSSQTTTPYSVFFKPDGLRMFLIETSTDRVYEYNLSTAWDISSASYSSNFTQLSSAENVPQGLFFREDGIYMYTVGRGSDVVRQYQLGGLNLSDVDSIPQGIHFKPDGTELYIAGDGGNRIYQASLSTAWDVSTSSSFSELIFGTTDGTPSSIFFKTDGTKMYVLGAGNDNVYEMSLSTAWDITTASLSHTLSVSSQDTAPEGMFFNPDGDKMYMCGTSGDAVYEYDLSTAWSLSSASYSQSFSVSSQEAFPNGIAFKSDGTKMFVIGLSSDNLHEYNLSTAWDISTASYSKTFTFGVDANPEDIVFKDDGTKFFITGSGSDKIYVYDIGE